MTNPPALVAQTPPPISRWKGGIPAPITGRPKRRLSPNSDSTNLNNKRRQPFRDIPDTSPKPIVWPVEFKRAPPVGRPIRLDYTRHVDTAPFFQLLNYDCRRLIYDAFLQARFRQHILCPSVARTGQPKELFSRYMTSRTCPDSLFTKVLACGHWDCLKSQDVEDGESDVRLADLVAFMRTSKFAYLEISEYLYRTMVFTFSSIPEMRAFVETTPETMLARIRFVSFIAHPRLQDPKACQGFIDGKLFQTEAEGDAIELFCRFANMERLEVGFYPHILLGLSQLWVLRGLVSPLTKIPKSTEIVVRIPRIDWPKSIRWYSNVDPLVEQFENVGRFKFLRPAVTMVDARSHCKDLKDFIF